MSFEIMKLCAELDIFQCFSGRLTEAGDMSQSLVDSGVPLSSFPLLSSSFLQAGSSASRISKACWNSLAAY